MKFYTRPRRTPQVIIVSLIDIFAILLIFVIVTTTFKRIQPEVTIKLPESKSAVSVRFGRLSQCCSRLPKERRFFSIRKGLARATHRGGEKLMAEKANPVVCDESRQKGVLRLSHSGARCLKEAGVKGNLSAFTEKK